VPGTVRFHRVLRAPPGRVYKAFLDSAALVKWLPPYGFTATMHSFDARVGGGYRMSFTNFSTGSSHSFGCEYVEMIPEQKLRYLDTFDDPNLPGVMEVSVTFTKSAMGTALEIVQSGIPAVIPVDACYLGWQESLLQLATLVEPDIPG
jgi:uncharacterized protein YndB with AHSA1/START domain